MNIGAHFGNVIVVVDVVNVNLQWESRKMTGNKYLNKMTDPLCVNHDSDGGVGTDIFGINEHFGLIVCS